MRLSRNCSEFLQYAPQNNVEKSRDQPKAGLMIGIVWIAESVTTHTHERDMFILRSDLNCISESVAC